MSLISPGLNFRIDLYTQGEVAVGGIMGYFNVASSMV